MTLWASDHPMLHDLGWRGAPSRSIIPRVTLFARLLLLLGRFLLVRFDESGRRRLQLLQFLNANVRRHQLLVECVIFGLQCAQLLLILAFPSLRLAQLLHHLTNPLQYLTEFLF